MHRYVQKRKYSEIGDKSKNLLLVSSANY